MGNLRPIEVKKQRIMTTKVLAEQFGTDEKIISNNFNRNLDRFIAGKHYYKLEGDELKEFKTNHLNDEPSMLRVNCLYLWTEKGAARHAKILDTDEAWQVYEELEETYFRTREQTLAVNQLSPELQMFNSLFKAIAQQELANKEIAAALQETKEEVQTIRDTVIIVPDDWREYCVNILRKIAYRNNLQYNDVNNTSYEALSKRASCDLERRLKGRRERAEQFGVAKSKIDKFNYLDCIGDDKKLIQIYMQIIKEMAIKYKVA